MDEINRTNLARVFLELMYLLEYRDRSVPLAGGAPFQVPENVRLLGTMNTTDRSIALVDHALRRRLLSSVCNSTTTSSVAFMSATRPVWPDVVRVLDHLQHKRLEYARRDGEHVFDAIENARVAVGAEAYYRAMYYGSHESWNLRDRHMVGTLERLLQFYGPSSKAVVWAHNSHVGDASATDMAARGELNVGQLCRRQFGEATYIIGFGTDHGTVAAASYWDGPMEVKQVRPSARHTRKAMNACSTNRVSARSCCRSRSPRIPSCAAS